MKKNYLLFDDASHVLRARNGDKKAVEALVQQYYGTVYAIALSNLGYDTERAEDLSQEVVLRAILNLSKLKHPEYFPRWLVQVTRNLAGEWKRHNRRQSGIIQMISADAKEILELKSQLPNPREAALAAEQTQRLHIAIQQLPLEQRELLHLHYAEELTQAQIARVLGVHSSTVMRKLDAAVTQLRKLVGTDGIVDLKQSRAGKERAGQTAAMVLSALALPGSLQASLVTACQLPGLAPTSISSKVMAAGFVKLAVLVTSLAAVALGGGLLYKGTETERTNGHEKSATLVARSEPSPRRHMVAMNADATADAVTPATRRYMASPHKARIDQTMNSLRQQNRVSQQSTVAGGDPGRGRYQADTTRTLYTVHGRVTELATNSPLPDVAVSIGRVRAVTNADGHYVLEQVNPNEQGVLSTGSNKTIVQATKNGYSMPPAGHSLAVATVELSPDTPAVGRDIELVKLVPIRGIVRTPDGRAVADTSTTLIQSVMTGAPETTRTDAEGNFELWGIPRSSVCVIAHGSDFAPSLSKPFTLPRQPGESIDLEVYPGVKVRGSVVDHQGLPAGNAAVAAGFPIRLFGTTMISNFAVPIETRTDDAGVFVLPHLPQGTVTLTAVAADKLNAKPLLLELADGEASPVVLRLPRPHFLAGRITNAQGQPLANVQVSAYARMTNAVVQGIGAQTDPDGNYRLVNLPDPPIELNIHSSGLPTKKVVEQLDREDANFVIGEDAVTPTTTFVGTVVDAASGEPVVNFSVLSDSGVTPVKSADKPGQFKVTGLRPGYSYSVTIDAPGCVPVQNRITASHGTQVTEQEFRMGPGGWVYGRVLDDYGNPATSATVEAKLEKYSHAAPEAAAQTLPDGRFRLGPFPEGEVYVTIVSAPDKPALKPIAKIVNGSETDLGDLRTNTGRTVGGIVLRSGDNSPVSGARVVLRSQPNTTDRLSTVTAATGKFEFSGVDNDSYTIELPEYGLRAYADLRTADSAQRMFRIGTASVYGRLLVRGKPLEGNGVLSLSKRVVMGQHSDLSTLGDPMNQNSFRFDNLVGGEWQVFAYHNGAERFYPQVSKLTVPDGETLHHDIELAAGKVTGTVVGPDGRGVANAHVVLTRLDTDSKRKEDKVAETTSDGDGRFSIGVLAEGQYEVSASSAKGLTGKLPEPLFVPNNQDVDGVRVEVK